MTTSTLFLLVGSLLCAGGWLVLWLGSRLLGIGVGMAVGFVFGMLFGLILDMSGATLHLVAFACAALGGFGGVFLIRAVSAWLFSLVGFLFGLLIARVGYQIYAELSGLSSELSVSAAVAIVLVAVGVALLTLWLRKYVLILATSFMGATFLCAGVAQLHDWLPWSFLGLFVGSLFWQSALSRAARPRKKEKSP